MTLYKQLAGDLWKFLEIIDRSSGRHVDHNHVGDGETSAKESMRRRKHINTKDKIACPLKRSS